MSYKIISIATFCFLTTLFLSSCEEEELKESDFDNIQIIIKENVFKRGTTEVHLSLKKSFFIRDDKHFDFTLTKAEMQKLIELMQEIDFLKLRGHYGKKELLPNVHEIALLKKGKTIKRVIMYGSPQKCQKIFDFVEESAIINPHNITVNSLINNLVSPNREFAEDSRRVLKALGDKGLNDLRESSSSTNRQLRTAIISCYSEIILDQHKDPAQDKFLMDSINDEYYMIRMIVIGALANSGHNDLANRFCENIGRPANDDTKIFYDIISDISIKEKASNYKYINPTMLEEGYLEIMGKKINPQLNAIITDEGSSVWLRKKLIKVYWQINKTESNGLFLPILEKTHFPEIKEAILSILGNELNRNNSKLIGHLNKLKDKENILTTKEIYKAVINRLQNK